MNEITRTVPEHLMHNEVPEAKKNVLGKDDFLKLLMTQLQHQDPLKPMDHQEFATQLAQFGQLEQLTNIGTGIQGLRSGMGEESKLQALGLIGKRVTAQSNEVEMVEGQIVPLRFTTDPSLQPVKATIFDGYGKPVREIPLTGQPKEEISWDGRNQDGMQLPAGKYTFRVHGVNRNGHAQEVGTELSGRVTGVEMRDEKPVLILQDEKGQSRLEMARVSKVMLDDSASPSGNSIQPQKIPVDRKEVAPGAVQRPTASEDLEEEASPSVANSDVETQREYPWGSFFGDTKNITRPMDF